MKQQAPLTQNFTNKENNQEKSAFQQPKNQYMAQKDKEVPNEQHNNYQSPMVNMYNFSTNQNSQNFSSQKQKENFLHKNNTNQKTNYFSSKNHDNKKTTYHLLYQQGSDKGQNQKADENNQQQQALQNQIQKQVIQKPENVKIKPSRTSQKKNGVIKAYAANTHQGLYRNYNEDRVTIILSVPKPSTKSELSYWPSCSFFAVYDGHGGASCSDFLRDKLHSYIINDENFPNKPIEAIKTGFQNAENDFIQKAEQENDKSGSCALVLIIIDGFAYIVNVGDSRAILSSSQGEKTEDLSLDHKPLLENDRIKRGGGRIYQNLEGNSQFFQFDGCEYEIPYRVFPGKLSVSRTIGDKEAKLPKYGGNPNVVICEPEIQIMKIKENMDYIFLASDGIYDRMSSVEVTKTIWNHCQNNKREDNFHSQCGESIKQVLKQAFSNKTLDNVSVVMVGLKNFKQSLFPKKEKKQKYFTEQQSPETNQSLYPSLKSSLKAPLNTDQSSTKYQSQNYCKQLLNQIQEKNHKNSDMKLSEIIQNQNSKDSSKLSGFFQKEKLEPRHSKANSMQESNSQSMNFQILSGTNGYKLSQNSDQKSYQIQHMLNNTDITQQGSFASDMGYKKKRLEDKQGKFQNTHFASMNQSQNNYLQDMTNKSNQNSHQKTKNNYNSMPQQSLTRLSGIIENKENSYYARKFENKSKPNSTKHSYIQEANQKNQKKNFSNDKDLYYNDKYSTVFKQNGNQVNTEPKRQSNTPSNQRFNTHVQQNQQYTIKRKQQESQTRFTYRSESEKKARQSEEASYQQQNQSKLQNQGQNGNGFRNIKYSVGGLLKNDENYMEKQQFSYQNKKQM